MALRQNKGRLAMNARENLLSLYRRQGYEFAPAELEMCPAIAAKVKDAVGEGSSLADHCDYQRGFARVGVPGPKRAAGQERDWRRFYEETLHPDTSFGDYGVAMERGYEGTHHLHRMHHPLAKADSLEQLKAYPWPEWDFEDIRHMSDAVSGARAQGLPAIGSLACTVWETAWYVRDMTALMTDMALDDEKASFIIDKVASDATKKAVAFAKAGVDILCLGDDIGMQRTIMMSLDMYRSWLKPQLAKVIAAAKSVKPDLLVQYHSCGFIEPYLPDLIDAGIDILNPVQPECMDFAGIHAEFGDVLSFNGTLGTQSTMPFGSPEDVKETVRRNLRIAGSRGGLLVAPTHMLEPEVPWANIEAYVIACRDYRP